MNPLRWMWSWWPFQTVSSLRVPSLRLYQQIIVLLVLMALLPLGIATIAIYNVNKRALRKELTGFSQQLAQAVYQDLNTEMSWQRRHAQTLVQLLALSPGVPDNGTLPTALPAQAPEASLKQLFALDTALDSVVAYDASGQPLWSEYRHYAALLPDVRFPLQLEPDSLPTVPVAPTGAQPTPSSLLFEVVYAHNQPAAIRRAYWLRVWQVLPNGQRLGLQRRFDYLSQLVQRSSASVHEKLYIVSAQGEVIAGPTLMGTSQPYQLSAQDNAFFQKLSPGVAAVYKTNVDNNWLLTNGLPAPSTMPPTEEFDPTTRNRELDTVFVKLPVIHWGVIIESPYHIQQNYIQAARTQMFFIVLGALALAMLLGLVYILGITRNFRQLIKGIKAMGKGNYARQIRLITNPVTPFEIIYVAGEFNRMARKISEGWDTIHQANQQLAKLDELKSNLIDTVSHELRTPLTIIKGNASRLLRHRHSLDAETQDKSLKVIRQQTDRLSRLVEDLLVIPDLEHQTLRVFPDEVPLLPLLERVLHPYYEQTDHVLHLDWPAEWDDSIRVWSDPDRLEQVLINLVDNAFKYAIVDTPIAITVSPPPEGDAPTLQVEVINACSPIPNEVVNDLFDKFRRMDDGLTRTTRGSGLGLFISKGLVEAMGGTIALASSNGQFRVSLTLQRLG